MSSVDQRRIKLHIAARLDVVFDVVLDVVFLTLELFCEAAF